MTDKNKIKDPDKPGAEKALAESEATLRKRLEGAMRLQSEIAGNIAEGVYLVNVKDLKIVYANPKMEEMFGYGPGEMNGKHVSIINAPTGGDPMKTARQIEKALTETGIWRGEVLNIRKDGTPFWGLASISKINLPEHGDVYVSLQRDITERKLAEEKLRKSETQLSESQKVAKIGSWSWDIVNNTLEWSVETYRRFDKDLGTFTPTVEYFVDRIHPEDREAVQKAIQDTINNDTPYHIQPKIINESGREWVMEGFGIVERDVNGNPLRFAGTAQDITENRQAEEALRASQKLLDMIFQAAPT